MKDMTAKQFGSQSQAKVDAAYGRKRSHMVPEDVDAAFGALGRAVWPNVWRVEEHCFASVMAYLWIWGR